MITYRTIPASELDDSLVRAWRAILARNPVYESPYFCPEYTRLVGSVRADVRVTIIEQEHRPVGFFPHQRSALGVGRPAGGPVSDYHGVVAEPGIAWDVRELMRAARLSVWTFDHLVGEVEKFEPYVAIRSRSPQMDLSGGFEQYLRGRREAGSEVARVESKARKIAREVGEPTFVLHDGSGEALAAMIGWKRAQYRRAGISDAFAVPWTSELLDRIGATQTPGFAGVCSALRVDGRIVAVHVGMRSDRVLHYWFPAYDPEFGKYSPGLVLVLRLAEAMSRAGVRAIDLGKGDSRYKESLMTGAVDLREGAVALPSLAASARRWRVRAEASAARGGLGAALRFPLRALRRVERGRKYR